MNTHKENNSEFRQKLRSNKVLHKTRNIIFSFIDFFYPLFRRFMPLKTFRYAACGGGVALLNILVFAIAHNFIVDKEQALDLGFMQMKPHTASFVIALCVSFPIGFLLNRYVVFQTSTNRGRVQLFRYAAVSGLNIFLTWALLRFFVDILGFWPTIAQMSITVILAVLSYFAQNHYSFKEKKVIGAEEAYEEE